MSLSHFFDILHDYVFASHFPNKFVSIEFFAYFAFFGRITSIRLYHVFYVNTSLYKYIHFFLVACMVRQGSSRQVKKKKICEKKICDDQIFQCTTNAWSMYIKCIWNRDMYTICLYVYQKYIESLFYTYLTYILYTQICVSNA